MAATKLNLKIEQGSEFSQVLYWKDANEVAIDLTGYKARMHIRSSSYSATTLLELTTENGRIIITPLTGKIEIKILASVTETFTWNSGVYDLELYVEGSPSPENDYVYRFIQGNVSVSPEVTR